MAGAAGRRPGPPPPPGTAGRNGSSSARGFSTSRGARSSCDRAPRPAQPLPVALVGTRLRPDPDPGSDPATIPLLGPGPGFSRAYAMTTDLTQPVIIATVPVPEGHPPRC